MQEGHILSSSVASLELPVTSKLPLAWNEESDELG